MLTTSTDYDKRVLRIAEIDIMFQRGAYKQCRLRSYKLIIIIIIKTRRVILPALHTVIQACITINHRKHV